jgi:hypothetical protein
MEFEDVDAELAAWAERTKQCPKKGDDGTDYKYDKEEYPEKKKETKKVPKKEEESYEEESSSEEGSGEEVRSVCCGKLRISCCGWTGYDCRTAARRCSQLIQLPRNFTSTCLQQVARAAGLWCTARILQSGIPIHSMSLGANKHC